MRELNRRDFLDSATKLTAGVYLSNQIFPWPAGAVENISVFENFPIPEITPVEKLYHQQIKGFPNVSVDTWRLKVTGAVRKPLSLSYHDLMNMEHFTILSTLKCVGDPVGGRQAGHLEWTGIKLKNIFHLAEIKSAAKDVVLHAADGYSDSFPAVRALGGEVTLALKMNGQKLTRGHGFPMRAIVPDIYGMKNVKWIDHIELTDYDYSGYWQKRGWSETANMKTFSTIFWPENLEVTEPVMLAGVAYAGARGLGSVQVSVDGKAWESAIHKPAMSKYSWTLWAYKLKTINKDKVSVKVRAIMKNGKPQVKGGWFNRSYPEGADGYHEVNLSISKQK